MLKSILGTNCDVDRLVPWLRRGPVRLPLFFPKPCTIRWCTGQPSFCLPFGFYLSLGCFHCVFFNDFFPSLLFCFLDEAGVFVGSSVVYLLFFLSFLHDYHASSFFVFVFVCFLFLPPSFPFSSSAFITSSFLLRICVHSFLLCSFPFHFQEGFL